jgi:hypothetical protein
MQQFGLKASLPAKRHSPFTGEPQQPTRACSQKFHDPLVIDVVSPDDFDHTPTMRAAELVLLQFGGRTRIVIRNPQAIHTKEVTTRLTAVEELGARCVERRRVAQGAKA